MSTKGDKSDARILQAYSGEHYTKCLRWVRTLKEDGLIQAEWKATPEIHPRDRDRGVCVRVAFHKRFPDITLAIDEDLDD